MHPDTITQLRDRAAALAPAGCVASRQVLELLDSYQSSDSLRRELAIANVNVLQLAEIANANRAIAKSAAERLYICSQLLGRCAERNPELKVEIDRLLEGVK